ncbi:MAG: DUF3616 domain-containing protein [Snowella sp.]|jgi:hypothetical protein|nr:MAG: DUF3616 domain-containing protein [Snowella sp.]
MGKSSLLNQVKLQFTGENPELREDLSAVHSSTDGYLWLGCDEGINIERLKLINLETKDTFGEHKSFNVQNYLDLPDGNQTEIDIEGLAESDDYLWLVGSHSQKRKSVKPEKSDAENSQRLATIEAESNRYLLARIPLINGELHKNHASPSDPKQPLSAAILELTREGNLLTEALADDSHLGPFIKADIPSKDNGFDIEGLAVKNNRIFLGLRGPVLRGWAIILELEVKNTAPSLLKLKRIGDKERRYKKLFVNLQGLGIREVSIEGDDLIILAGPTMDLDGPVKIFRLENGTNFEDESFSHPTVVMDIPYGDGFDHAEGITQLTSLSGKPALLVVYDSPDRKRLVGTQDILVDVFEL